MRKLSGLTKAISATIITGVAVGAGLNYIPGCVSEQPQRVAEVRNGKETLEEKFPVAPKIQLLICGNQDPIGNETIILEDLRNGVYRGKNSYIFDAKEAEIYYNAKSKNSFVKLKIGTFFPTTYTYKHQGYISRGEYTAKSRGGKEKRFRITTDPFSKELSVWDWIDFNPFRGD